MPGASGASSVDALPAALRRADARARARSSSRGKPPGRSSIGSPRQATMVDSTPTGVGPPSTIRSMRPRRSASTCCGGGRRDMAGAVGRRRDHRPAERREQIARDRMVGHAHRDAVEAGGGELGDRTVRRASAAPASAAPARTPPRAARRRRRSARAARAAASVGHMRDQRIERRPALGGIEPRHRLAVGGVGAEPVDGLGRERDEAARREAARAPPRSPRGRPAARASPARRSSPGSCACGVRGADGYKTGLQSECSAAW